jgi:UDPglucose--hexose-1-phosphate uridylyltransferase
LFSPKHNLTLPEMPIEAIENIVHTWQKEYTDLGNVDYINHVHFLKIGSVMGCSNPSAWTNMHNHLCQPEEKRKTI